MPLTLQVSIFTKRFKAALLILGLSSFACLIISFSTSFLLTANSMLVHPQTSLVSQCCMVVSSMMIASFGNCKSILVKSVLPLHFIHTTNSIHCVRNVEKSMRIRLLCFVLMNRLAAYPLFCRCISSCIYKCSSDDYAIHHVRSLGE